MAVKTSAKTPAEGSNNSTLWEQLKAGDRLWKFKSAIRGLQCVVSLIGLTGAAWILDTSLFIKRTSYVRYSYLPVFADTMSATMAVPIFAVSLAWGLFDLATRFLRKNRRPAHPGLVLANDLLLWLVMPLVVAFAVAGALGMNRFGAEIMGQEVIVEPTGAREPYNGIYSWGQYLRNASTGTWEFSYIAVNDKNSRFEYDDNRGLWVARNGTAVKDVRDCTGDRGRLFTCEEQDRIVNDMWRQKPRRVSVVSMIAAMGFLALLFHFTLFVRACIEVHRRRKSKRVEKLREELNWTVRGKSYEELPRSLAQDESK